MKNNRVMYRVFLDETARPQMYGIGAGAGSAWGGSPPIFRK